MPANERKERPARSHPGHLRRLLGQLTMPKRLVVTRLRNIRAPLPSGLSRGAPDAWMICPPCQARLPDCRPRLLCWEAAPGSPRIPSPGHAHWSTPRAPRHPPSTYIMNRETYPRPPKPWICTRSPRRSLSPPAGRGPGRGADNNSRGADKNREGQARTREGQPHTRRSSPYLYPRRPRLRQTWP
jgi:hypothetical protein